MASFFEAWGLELAPYFIVVAVIVSICVGFLFEGEVGKQIALTFIAVPLLSTPLVALFVLGEASGIGLFLAVIGVFLLFYIWVPVIAVVLVGMHKWLSR